MHRLSRQILCPQSISRVLKPTNSAHGPGFEYFGPDTFTRQVYIAIHAWNSNPNALKALTEEDSPSASLFETLTAHLQTPEVRHILDALPPQEQQLIQAVLHEIAKNPEDEVGYRQMAEMLEECEVSVPKAFEALTAYDVEEYLRKEEEDDEDDNESWNTWGFDIKPRKEEPHPEFFNGLAETTAEPPQRPPPNPFPNLMVSDPLLDSRDVLELPPDKDTPFHNRVIIRNHSSIFNEALAEDGFDFGADDYVPTTTDETEESASSLANLPFSPSELANFYRFPLIHKRITQQTGKGKIHRQFVLMVVGNGDGLVGLGQGKDDDASRAEAKAYAQAVRNMDWVERFEKRTIWTDMEVKLGATQLILRPRPVGFGLRCNPNLHQVLKAAGIKDISAKVWGSRNPINVIKAAFRMLQAGHAPLAMGDGIGGPGRKLNKGSGLRSKSDMERERGRQLISLRK
ncbi:hypothetical protein DXG03_003631 [Asterophora parasitica]|uniref:Small ribosomal subunit protein uS5m n=1 Tax=Asterophora parasitica TaxID=117018 RepID=A0A9P7G4R8_9AGAR|nr:hypothetical protein DXG03_003631 [Asterophora parasitica]